MDKVREFINRRNKWQVFALILGKPSATFNPLDTLVAYKAVKLMRELSVKQENAKQGYENAKRILACNPRLPRNWKPRKKMPKAILNVTATPDTLGKAVSDVLSKIIDKTKQIFETKEKV